MLDASARSRWRDSCAQRISAIADSSTIGASASLKRFASGVPSPPSTRPASSSATIAALKPPQLTIAVAAPPASGGFSRRPSANATIPPAAAAPAIAKPANSSGRGTASPSGYSRIAAHSATIEGVHRQQDAVLGAHAAVGDAAEQRPGGGEAGGGDEQVGRRLVLAEVLALDQERGAPQRADHLEGRHQREVGPEAVAGAGAGPGRFEGLRDRSVVVGLGRGDACRAVADQREGDAGQGDRRDAAADEGGRPAEAVERGLERDRAEQLAERADDAGQRRQQRAHAGGKPALRQPQDVDQDQRVAHADQRAAGDRGRDAVGEAEDQLAGGDRDQPERERAARADAVGGEAGRDLHREVDQELQRGEAGEHLVVEVEPLLGAQPGDAERHAVEDGGEVEARADAPDQPGAAGGSQLVDSLHLCRIYRIIPAVTAASRAYDHVKERLLAGDYADGELLSEGAIADELGISRTPVREALLQLQAERLLTLYPKRGALVTPMSPREVADLFEVRELVERHALAVADPAVVVPALEAVLTRQRELLAADDRAGFAAADRDFHRAWVAAAGNRDPARPLRRPARPPAPPRRRDRRRRRRPRGGDPRRAPADRDRAARRRPRRRRARPARPPRRRPRRLRRPAAAWRSLNRAAARLAKRPAPADRRDRRAGTSERTSIRQIEPVRDSRSRR